MLGRITTMIILVATSATSAAAQSPTDDVAEEPSLFVLDVAAAEDLDPALPGLVRDLMVSHLQSIGRYRLTTSADLQTMLGVEAQKQLSGCDDQSCVAEIMGALGAGFILGSQLSRFGERVVLTLRLINAKETRLENQLTETLPDEEEALLAVVRTGTYDLMGVELPVEESPWYASPWLWVTVGVVVAGALAVGGYFLLAPSGPPQGQLGTVFLDAS